MYAEIKLPLHNSMVQYASAFSPPLVFCHEAYDNYSSLVIQETQNLLVDFFRYKTI